MKRKKFSGSIIVAAALVLTVGVALNRHEVSALVPYNNARVNLDSSGGQANFYTPSNSETSMSRDGRFIAFASGASNLISGDTNGKQDIFVKDRSTGGIIRANVSTSSAQTTTETIHSKISANGRYVIFSSMDYNLVSGIGGGNNVFVRDLQNNTTELISVSYTGGSGNAGSADVFDISSDGRYAVFSSQASNLVSSDTNGYSDVFVRDRSLGTTTMLSKSSGGTQGNNNSQEPSMSCEGSIIAFNSLASNLVSSDTNAKGDVFYVNRIGSDTIYNLTAAGNNHSLDQYNNSVETDVSCDGSTIAFASQATNLSSITTTTNRYNIYTYNLRDNVFSLASQNSSGTEGNSVSYMPSLSGDGRYVAFYSAATNLASGITTTQYANVFFRDTTNSSTEIISMRNSSTQTTALENVSPSISNDGRYITYITNDSGLVTGDTNGYEDVFIAATGAQPCSI